MGGNRQGGKNRGGKKWSRKRKAEEHSAKSGKERDNNNKSNGWNVIPNSNAKFEAYYSLIGLHDTRRDGTSGTFVPCTSDEEKHAERDLFMSTLAAILPASFRVDRSLDPTIQRTLLEELQQFVGREMELEVELPTRSPAFGGIKNILDNGTDVEGGGGGVKDESKQNENAIEDAKQPTDVSTNDVTSNSGGEGEKKVDGVKKDESEQNKSTDDAKQTTEGDDVKDATKNSVKKTSHQYSRPIIVKKTIAPAKPIPFISSNNVTLGYQLSVDRRTLRRNKSLEPLHTWMKIQSDCGHITRQETVSMIPPVVLNAEEGMSVLDMCAAPGSKTCQLLEVVGGLAHSSSSGQDDGKRKEGELEPAGYVVANDADPKRAYMLVNQLRRMNSPSVFVTSCDGQYFPILDEKSAKGTEREGMFDRVLADVPCSGDGTIRKNPGIWKRWNQLGSLALHPLQLSIALRGARLTKVGGYLVYSTCSMNPMENESVVAELLRISEGALVLEDPRGRMEGLLARPGWSAWRVLRESKERTRRAMKDRRKKNNPKMQAKRKEWEEKRARGECGPPKEQQPKKRNEEEGNEEQDKVPAPSPYDTMPYVPPATWDDAALSDRTTSLGFFEYASYDDVEPDWKRRVRASCFPPTEDEAKRFELHKCLRSLPQDMDTGGFFVALLKKVKPLGKNATERMNALTRESLGGVEVDAHLKTGDGDEEKKSDNDKESGDVAMTESSAAKDSGTEAKPVDAIKDKGGKPEEKDKDDEEPVQKAPQGKVGMNHKHKKKEKDLGTEDFIPADPSIWRPIIEEYGLAPTFPKEQFMVRAAGDAKILYFITKSIKEGLIDHGIQDRVTVINSGLKSFQKCSLKDEKVSYRLTQEGIQYVVPHMTKRIMSANTEDFFICMKEGYLSFDKFSESFQKELEGLGTGSFIVTLKGYEKHTSKKMYLSMWRYHNAVNCFVAKVEIEAILSKMRALGFVDKEEQVSSSPMQKPEADEKMDIASKLT
mmetsp:Transcript_21032/g.50720  ORF Transcript_21032/g.50720 Transcript_21032/m.50720 type:complete len:995 (-) Transcript_21032:106-3090(-)|eukprot:CAMPEP_0181099872 /NCGR_PEP_ID=MMETSP1071-20121207/12890_1 /TAXON_ID=35127 /ORGANISM="Thalassiosira sp., Strain NH16" /LENGTH=994 /DNA_ID=CAMNT_0023182561 /DNA_START=146 /DNA_END=3133 /DNA_ORIENTATION=+